MTRPRPPYLQREVDRHGKVKWYVRIRPNPRIRIIGEYGSSEFMQSYKNAVNGIEERVIAPSSNSLSWLITEYRKSSNWNILSNATKRQRDNIFLHVMKRAGDKPYSAITKKVIIASREERAATPSQAGNFLKAMNGLFKWAVEYEIVKDNPCDGVKAPRIKYSEGFAAWNEEDVEKYEITWAEGTKERVWLHVLLYTGLRRGDVVKIGRQHVRDGVATIKTEKSGFRTEVTLPILPELQKTLDCGPTGDLSFVCGSNGQPLTKESFGNMFREACNKAGVQKSAHGVRKISATRAANAGATQSQLMALFGWEDNEMASLYTKTADRRKLASESIEKLKKQTK